mgnify:CR=1 FL=1|tara:strand:+ start:207 stop:479 length:273 start_codon:yes stop_codon:yes gene_type:complete
MSKEIIDKINNNLIMLVEGFDDAERDYGYDMANEKHYVSELIELVKNLSLSGVSQQREMLIAYLTTKTHEGLYFTQDTAEKAVDEYLSNL